MFDRLNKENDGDFGVVVVQPIKEGSVVSLLNEQDGLYDLGLRGLIDGDLVVIRKQNYANVGDIVVALDDENQNTLKTLCFDEDERRYYLHPENEKYDDIQSMIIATKRAKTAVTGILKRHLKQVSAKRKLKFRETETVSLNRSLSRKIRRH